MFGMTRAEVQKVLEKTYRADSDFRAARGKEVDPPPGRRYLQ
jgi:hypothetical protein